MKILLHSCCGPCLSGSYPILVEDFPEAFITAFWHNPNIHPYIEYLERFKSFLKTAKILNLSVLSGDTAYGLGIYIKALEGDYSRKRCAKCYEMRLMATAKAAVAHGFDAFTTTLLISPYQNHKLIHEVGDKIAKEHNLKYIAADFSSGFSHSKDFALEHDIYRQKYCGCIFSEHDRYSMSKKHKVPMQSDALLEASEF
ncbi:MAG: epoxyqueuosine reductase QueH [Candidatus Riflebacteria bacterium]|nr:epoxyqueuosine reductase QueH [Candidatus Riflebacteria bacterium]